MKFTTQNPTTGEPLQEYSYQSTSDIENTISNSVQAWQSLKQTSVKTRTEAVQKIATNLRAEKENLARLMALEMGKPLRDGRAEVEKCAITCEYLANHAESLLKTTSVQGQYQRTEILKQSLGPVLIIMPWNFPIWQVIRAAIPNLLLGNPVLLKHSDIVAGTSALLTRILQQSSPTPLSFQELKIDHAACAKVIQDFRIRGVSFTGSTRGGAEIAKLAAAAIKKTVLELGGSDAYITCKDADISLAAKISATAKLINNGQSCIAAKRFYVHTTILETWLGAFKSELSKFPASDPSTENSARGPLAHIKFKTCLEEQVTELQNCGAKMIWQDLVGPDSSVKTAFAPIQILQAPLGLDWVNENEIFGPVAIVIAFADEAQMISDLNASRFGLGAAVFSEDLSRAKAIAERLDVGMVAINAQVKSDARTPFGGVKNSGYGREMGTFGDLEFCNIKTLGID